jgi:hypothetical protein
VSAIATPLTAAHAIAVIKKLPPAELRKFNRQLSTWQQHGQKLADEEALLLERIKENSCLPAVQHRRYQMLRQKCGRRTLTESELTEYQGLIQQLESRNVKRIEALSALARRRGTTLRNLVASMRPRGKGNGD